MKIDYYNTKEVHITGNNGNQYIVRDTSNGGVQCVVAERKTPTKS